MPIEKQIKRCLRKLIVANLGSVIHDKFCVHIGFSMTCQRSVEALNLISQLTTVSLKTNQTI